MTPIRWLALVPVKSCCCIRLYQKATYKLSNCHRNANNHKLPFFFTRIENCVILEAIGLIHLPYALHVHLSLVMPGVASRYDTDCKENYG